MSQSFRATEKGSTFFSEGSENKYSFFALSYIQDDPELTADPDQIQFDVTADDFFINSPKLFICVDQASLQKVLAEADNSLEISVVLKEQSSRRSNVIYATRLNDIDHGLKDDGIVELIESQFLRYTLANDLYIDLVATIPDRVWIKRIVGYKRFNLMFGIGKGLFTPVPKPPEFFVHQGGGEDSLWLVELSATDSSAFTDMIASEVIQVYINEEAARKFGKLCNAGVAGDMLSRLFVSDVISETLSQMLNLCPSMPESTNSGSVVAKLLPKLKLDDSNRYDHFREQARRNPALIRTKVQELCRLSSTAQSSTR